MSNSCESIYQTCRKSAGFSQESAAGFLSIAPRTLAGYEAGAAPVPDDIAAKMTELYKAPLLGYQHLQLNPVARRFLPVLEDKSLSQAALSLICAAGNYMAQQSQMVMVCADGKVDNAENTQWEQVNQAIIALIKAAFTLLLAPRD
jgi:transcriptional regulator with XRE-family HTH domain